MRTRRDRCYLAGQRMAKLRTFQGEMAWFILAQALEGMGEKDMPKFNDLLEAIRAATLKAKKT